MTRRNPRGCRVDKPEPALDERHFSKPLTPRQITALRVLLSIYGDEVGLEQLARLATPTRLDLQHLQHLAKAKYAINSDTINEDF